MPWLSVLPLVVTIAIAILYKRIIPALLIGTLLGGYLLDLQPLGGFEATVEHLVRTLTDPDSTQVLLFLFLFSGLIGIIQRSGGIQAFSTVVGERVHSERGVFYLLWALIPATFIDCGLSDRGDRGHHAIAGGEERHRAGATGLHAEQHGQPGGGTDPHRHHLRGLQRGHHRHRPEERGPQ